MHSKAHAPTIPATQIKMRFGYESRNSCGSLWWYCGAMREAQLTHVPMLSVQGRAACSFQRYTRLPYVDTGGVGQMSTFHATACDLSAELRVHARLLQAVLPLRYGHSEVRTEVGRGGTGVALLPVRQPYGSIRFCGGYRS